ncbi:MAG: type II toxin-antitoxin system HigB family toxin [Brevundimonas sp.]|nr:type II toxin-antitoxin system HigB family toxin [Brevundimonas sp.]
MRIIARNNLTDYWARHPLTQAPLSHWLRVTKAATWTDPQAVLADFSKAKALNGERVRFDIGGGDHRLIVAFDFPRQVAFIKFIGTHAEYDRVDALTISRF